MAIIDNFIKKGFTPLACNKYAGIAWQGELLKNFWMWNRVISDSGGVKYIQTIKVTDLKEAAIRYWRDNWVPVVDIDEAMLRRMENALRAHKGLKAQGNTFPDGPFLSMPESLPDYAMTGAILELREAAGKAKLNSTDK